MSAAPLPLARSLVTGCGSSRSNVFGIGKKSIAEFCPRRVPRSRFLPPLGIRNPVPKMKSAPFNGRAIRRDILSATSARQRPRLWQRLGQPTIFATKISLHFFHALRPVLARLPRSLFPSPRSHSLAGPHSPPGPIVSAWQCGGSDRKRSGWAVRSWFRSV